MRFVLQSHKENIEDSGYNEVIDFSEPNIGVSL